MAKTTPATTTNIGCTVCGQQALVRCARCEERLCASHAPLAGKLCQSCEEAYTLRRARLRVWPWFVLPFLSTFTYLLLQLRQLLSSSAYGGKGLTGHPFSDVLIYTVCAGLLFGGLVAGLRMAVFKLRFRR
jgi:hypothetical protein